MGRIRLITAGERRRSGGDEDRRCQMLCQRAPRTLVAVSIAMMITDATWGLTGHKAVEF